MAKLLKGTVVSLKMAKTAVVLVETMKPHPIYKKRITRNKRYKAHVEGITLSEGDTVIIQETRPLSRDKHFRVIKRVA